MQNPYQNVIQQTMVYQKTKPFNIIKKQNQIVLKQITFTNFWKIIFDLFFLFELNIINLRIYFYSIV